MIVSYGMYDKNKKTFHIFDIFPCIKLKENNDIFSYAMRLTTSEIKNLFFSFNKFYSSKEYFEENYKNLFIRDYFDASQNYFHEKYNNKRYGLKKVFFEKSRFSFMSFLLVLSFLKKNGKNLSDIVNENTVFYKIHHDTQETFLKRIEEIKIKDLFNESFFENSYYFYDKCYFSIKSYYTFDDNKKFLLSLKYFDDLHKKASKLKKRDFFDICVIFEKNFDFDFFRKSMSNIIKNFNTQKYYCYFFVNKEFSNDVELYLNTVLSNNDKKFLIFDKNKIFNFIDVFNSL